SRVDARRASRVGAQGHPSMSRAQPCTDFSTPDPCDEPTTILRRATIDVPSARVPEEESLTNLLERTHDVGSADETTAIDGIPQPKPMTPRLRPPTPEAAPPGARRSSQPSRPAAACVVRVVVAAVIAAACLATAHRRGDPGAREAGALGPASPRPSPERRRP